MHGESLEGHAARISLLERLEIEDRQEMKELHADLRKLTEAVADLSKSVAVLSERIGNSRPSPSTSATVGVGAAGGGLIAVIIEAIQRIHW